MTAADVLSNMLQSEGLKDFVSTYNVATTVALAISTIAVMCMIILNIVKLARSADNPKDRKEAIQGIIICGICFAVLGSIDAVYALFVNLVLGNV